MIETLGGNIWCPNRSFKKDVPRATAVPLIAPNKCLIMPPEIRGSKMTGAWVVDIFLGFNRFTARSPALLPIDDGEGRSSQCTAEAKS